MKTLNFQGRKLAASLFISKSVHLHYELTGSGMYALPHLIPIYKEVTVSNFNVCSIN